jgi:50S ribosomal protein L16 3-hydroxylase
MTAILGGLSPASFLRDYWQKRPLLVRQALPGFSGVVDREALFALARRSDAVSRLVLEHPGRRSRWERHDGPFDRLSARALPKERWTLLVHGVESLVPGGWELLRAFSFIPAARIDDLMVSYAAPGGSVGAHVDRYDVFLLQGPGRRRWQVSAQDDLALDPRAAIKVLERFVPDEEWLLEPGDMLYLPPGVAHLGVAEGPCFTYSIGFLAPTHEELVQSFLGYLGEALGPAIDPDAIYEDPELRPQADWLALGDAMVGQVQRILGAIRWDATQVEEFLGRLLTQPKAHARFQPPRRVLSPDAFARRLRGRGRLTLALPSRGLTRGGRLFFNGQVHAARPSTLRLFSNLVTARSLPLPLRLDDHALALFHAWHTAGFTHF